MPINSSIWCATSSGAIHVFKLEKGEDEQYSIRQLASWEAHENSGRITSMAFIHNHVWSCCATDGKINIWDPFTHQLIHSLTPFNAPKIGPTKLLVFKKGNIQYVWVACSFSGSFTIYKIIQSPSTATPTSSTSSSHSSSSFSTDPPKYLEFLKYLEFKQLIGMTGLAYHRNLIWVAVSGQIFFINTNTYEVIGCFEAHNTGRMPMILESIGDNVWSSTLSELKIWNFNFDTGGELQLLRQVSLGDSKFECFLPTPDLSIAYSGSFSGEVVMWDVPNVVPLQEVVPTTYSIKSLCLDHHNDSLQLGTDNSFIWCSTSRREIFVFHSQKLHPPIPNDMKMKTNRRKPKLAETDGSKHTFEEVVRRLALPLLQQQKTSSM